MSLHPFLCVYVCMYVCIYTYTRMYTYIYVCVCYKITMIMIAEHYQELEYLLLGCKVLSL